MIRANYKFNFTFERLLKYSLVFYLKKILNSDFFLVYFFIFYCMDGLCNNKMENLKCYIYFF